MGDLRKKGCKRVKCVVDNMTYMLQKIADGTAR